MAQNGAGKGKERILTYEVQVLVGGRWEIHSRFPADAKDSAMEEVQDLEQSGNTIKVFKEVYNLDSNESMEVMVYKTSTKAEKIEKEKSKPPPPAKKKPEKKKKTKSGAEEKKAELEVSKALGQGPKEPEKKPPASITRVMLKLLFITLGGVGIAFALSWIATLVLQNAGAFGYRISGSSRTNLVFAVFVLSFLLSAVPMAIYMLSRENLNFEFGGPRRPAKGEAKKGGHLKSRRIKGMSVKDQATAEKRVAEVVARKGGPDNGETQKKDDDKPKFEMPEKKKEPPPLNTWGEKQKTLMLNFLDDHLARLDKPTSHLDNYNKFGVNLFLAGAIESLSTDRQLDVRATSHILSQAVQSMGFKKTQAQSFADRYQDYLLADRRYMGMFQAGRASIEKVLQGEPDDCQGLNRALKDWNKPKDAEEANEIITVLFTDMVGSTAMTQTLGDAGAQKVVRAHNSIVRSALQKFRGKEVKHTGDGIMASFNVTTDAVEASIEIQERALHHTKQNPDLPLRLKIGLHSGQAIAEDDDLFGTHVQLAARIVDKAGEGEIFVSDVAHGICAGKGINFVNQGQYELKGFPEPVTVFSVTWSGEQEAQAAAQAAEEAARAEEEAKKRDQELEEAEAAAEEEKTEAEATPETEKTEAADEIETPEAEPPTEPTEAPPVPEEATPSAAAPPEPPAAPATPPPQPQTEATPKPQQAPTAAPPPPESGNKPS